ncbi:dihydrolipoyl dehydrogenase family protein [Draconibacterium halophilum]|uniref:NAD(P)/FAD-dependent oxidoreductase n=1 Tax=Draconibacterium halophilum TaxID=2706887 RepID=A0A6C0RFX7_9BACT|nr:NAD(P)/FAD-dependent oxidoreductase [Draconibacterium halophilum]QIA08977.1 NAD(P)/FAD-dependent oxidoreductase [Draconibacterium halophilum]
MKEFDVFVIGTGVAGTAIANTCVKEGLSVGIADERPYGGTCATRGCIPKKVLWGVVHAAASAKRLNGKGIDQTPTINWKNLMEFKNTFVKSVPKEKEKTFKKDGITTFHGTAKFLNENQLQIGNETIKAKKIVIATGAKPRNLSFNGAENLGTSDDFLELKNLPKHVLFIGGGYIAFEFAHIAALCGSKVTILDKDDSLLKNFEQDMVKHIVAFSKKIGINLVLNAEVEEIIKTENDFRIITKKAGSKVEFTTEFVINSSGRMPAISNLALENGNVAHSEKGIEVDSYLRSVSNPNVYAAGDVAASDGLPLTPLASMEANVISSQLTGNGVTQSHYSVMPSAVFTYPPLASVGYTEKEALSRKLDFKVNSNSVADWFSAKHIKAPVYAYKILIDTKTEKIVGAHLVGPHAEETINLFAMAMKVGLTTSEIRQIPFVFPSSAYDIASMV